VTRVRIMLLTDNFPPEFNAPATRSFEHAQRWIRAGAQVVVVTTTPNFPAGKVFPGYRNLPFQRETLAGVDVVRVWTYVTANRGIVRRSLDYLSFMCTGLLAALFLPRPDVIIGTSPQFFAACAAWGAAVVKRSAFVFELRDLWPDSIVAVGAMRESAAIRMLRRVEYFLYDKAARIVTVTESFKRELVQNGIPGDKIAVVRNGVDLAEFTPGPAPNGLRAKHGLGERFVAAYIGTIGMAHGLETVLQAAERLRDDPRIAFLLVGDGAERSRLQRLAESRGLENVVFAGAVKRGEIIDYWRLAGAALILLRDRTLFRQVLPSKMFEAMATGCPIVLGVRGESAQIVESSSCGVVVPPEDDQAVARAVLGLANDPAEAARLGRNGRRQAAERFDRDELALTMLSELRAAACG